MTKSTPLRPEQEISLIEEEFGIYVPHKLEMILLSVLIATAPPTGFILTDSLFMTAIMIWQALMLGAVGLLGFRFEKQRIESDGSVTRKLYLSALALAPTIALTFGLVLLAVNS